VEHSEHEAHWEKLLDETTACLECLEGLVLVQGNCFKELHNKCHVSRCGCNGSLSYHSLLEGSIVNEEMEVAEQLVGQASLETAGEEVTVSIPENKDP
jgi:hypothetical protein